MRKVAVKCAAANDDDDLGGSFSITEKAKRSRIPVSADTEKRPRTEATAEASQKHVKTKKEKEFAWMDSEDEDSDAERQREKDHSERVEDAKDEDDEEVTLDKLDSVHTFGRMVLLEPALLRKLKDKSSGPEGIVTAACRALARTKFFDADLQEELGKVVARMLSDGKLDAKSTNDVILYLHTLNSYNKAVFTAVARAFRSKVAQIEPPIRAAWFEVYKSFGHDLQPDFVQLLEKPPLPVASPMFKKVRCEHNFNGRCELGSACTYSHDMLAPITLAQEKHEDNWRQRSTMLTQDQKALGMGAYGAGPLAQMRGVTGH